ncbi:MAG: hypothetical protein OXI37_02225 [Gammaproteobacteria bacterium]|nr:hypothetical protein [Gammaproteobacteria bacterium]
MLVLSPMFWLVELVILGIGIVIGAISQSVQLAIGFTLIVGGIAGIMIHVFTKPIGKTGLRIERKDRTAYRFGLYRTRRKERYIGVYFERPNGQHYALLIKRPFFEKSVAARPKGPLIARATLSPIDILRPKPKFCQKLWRKIRKGFDSKD